MERVFNYPPECDRDETEDDPFDNLLCARPYPFRVVCTFSKNGTDEMAEHTGQSSQLFPVALGRNAQFLATIQIDLNVSHTGKDYHEFDNSNPLITIVT